MLHTQAILRRHIALLQPFIVSTFSHALNQWTIDTEIHEIYTEFMH